VRITGGVTDRRWTGGRVAFAGAEGRSAGTAGACLVATESGGALGTATGFGSGAVPGGAAVGAGQHGAITLGNVATRSSDDGPC